MDAKRNRNKMLADTNESGYVWTGPILLKPKLVMSVMNNLTHCTYILLTYICACNRRLGVNDLFANDKYNICSCPKF